MKLHFIATSLLLLLLSGCAGQRLPEGGPVDSEPPKIVSVFPQPGTVNFSGTSIVIEFSEYVERRSAEEAIFISPNIEGKEFEWSGTELEIVFNEDLRQNTTYVVTIGTDVTDIRANNRMAASFTLSFSTGPTIDKGTIEGKVVDEKPDGVMIFSYRLNNIRPDTLNPAVTKPDYLSQAGKNGEFQLKNIAPGTYRLFAIRDDYRNLLYEPEIDAAGTTKDITLTAVDTQRTGIQFTIAKDDTTPPRLAQVQATDEHHVTVQFSEPLDSSSVNAARFNISDTVFTSTVPIIRIFSRDETMKDITLVTAQQKSDERYVLAVNGVNDRSGFTINQIANAKQFNASSVKDTLPPVLITSTIKDPSVKIFPDERIELFFSDALQWPISDTSLIVRRLKDSSIVPVTRTLRTPASIQLRPATPWIIGDQYSILVRSNSIMDLFGNAGKDSSDALRFTIDDPENYGSIDGSFAGYSAANTVVQAENLVDKKQLPRKVRANASGVFSFTRLPEGKYLLKVFDDVNSNLLHDAGKVFPYRVSEQFNFFKDTIRVRARWPVDGVIFKAP